MPQKTNLNVAPYYDDFDRAKNFYKVLFRSGYSIQTRELTSIQSILQNQIESYGRFQFKQGDLVVPGEVGLNKRLNYVKLSSVSEVPLNVDGEIVYQKYDIKKLVGTRLQGVNSGVEASVLAVEYGTETQSEVIYVKYIGSGNSSDERTFRQGETLEVIDGVNTPLLVVGTDGSVLPTSINLIDPETDEVSSIESLAMGYASAVKVEEGVYFVNGYFVRCNEELLVVDKYYDQPSAKIGFNIVEEIVTPEADKTLYDNSKGFSNSSAPGAHRLKISLSLVKYEYNAPTDKNFIQILKIKQGEIERQIRPADYSLLETTLARRTYDESGDYVVNNFPLEVREYYQQGDNLGIYRIDDENLVNGLTPSVASKKLVAALGPGKAYVKGYEIVNTETKYVSFDKSRDTLTRDNVTLKSKGVSQFKITNVYGSIPLNAEGSDLTGTPTIYLNSLFNDGSIGLNNTELSTDHKQTKNRRGSGFSIDDGIRTIYIQVTSTTNTLASVTETTLNTTFSTLWFIKTRSGTTPSTVDSVNTLSFSKVKRLEVDSTAQYLEITVIGKKNIIEQFLKEYDDQASTYQRDIYLTESDALAAANKFGHIVDYNETITPIIGVTKPKNFALVSRGSGFNQNTDKVISKGRTSSGTSTYNTIFSLNHFNPVFFTRLLLDSVVPSNNFTSTSFTSGSYIFGSRSGAYGVIEGGLTNFYSAGNYLFVNTLSGTFVPGETIVDERGNSLRIANENTISHFVVTKRGSGYTSPTLRIDGVEFDNSNIQVTAVGGGIYKVIINNRDAVQTVYSQPPVCTASSTTTPGVLAEITPVMFRNVVSTYTPQNVKSFFSQYGSGNAYKFSADSEIQNNSYAEIVAVTNSTFSGEEGRKYLECNGFDADASRFLIQGDIVQFNDSTGRSNKVIVQYATPPIGPKKSRIYLDSSLPAIATNVSVVRLRPLVSNSDTNSLIFPTGSKEVSSLVKTQDDSNIKTYIRRDFVINGSSSGGQLTFVAQLTFGTQRFTEFTENNYIITVLSKGSSTVVENGDIVYIDPSFVNVRTSSSTTSTVSAGSVTINLPSDYFGSISSNFPVLKLSATIEVTKAKPRLKTSVKNKRLVIVSGGDKNIPLRGQDYDTSDVNIYSFSDVYNLRYVYEGSSTNPPQVDTNGRLISGTDVTNNFIFDDGQRDTFYDVSRIILKPGSPAPTGQLVVAFDYFEHSQGDFCTVDSYLHEAGVLAEEVPSFNSSVHGIVSLKDVIDFRPKVDNDTLISGFQNSTILSTSDYANFNGDGGVSSSCPASDLNISYTFSFSETKYLDRIDGVFLKTNGQFEIRSGNSSLNPSKPETIENSIPLYYLYVPAFTKLSEDVRLIPVDNKRYTMRDIGKLEKRIERLEYYTTLSILEQQALNMQVKDDIGLDRFKSGFIVDNFETHSVGNIKSNDYRCSIDTQQSTLRAQSKEDCFNLVELNTREDERVTNHYKKSGSIVTLPYTSTRLLGNNSATKILNPNPFVIVQFVGDGKLSPSVDQWFDTSVTPLVSEDNTNLYSFYTARKDNSKEAIASYFNSFVVNWIGSNRSFFNITPLNNTSASAATTVIVASVASSSNISPYNNETARGVSNETRNGNSIISSVQFFMRSIPVKYNLTRLKPNTRFYVFMDGRDIGRWINPDIRYTGVPSNSLSSFGNNITTDANGNASGILLIPAGYPPTAGATWTGDVKTVTYDTAATQLRYTTGIRTLRFTSSSTDESKDTVESYTEIKYYATGALPENPASIVSTVPAEFKANEGTQIVDVSTSNRQKPNPLSQTFTVEGQTGGCFATAVDLFFKRKSATVPLRVYITDTSVGKPGKNIVPGSVCAKNPNTYLRVVASSNLNITIGERITGRNSGAAGPLLQVLDKNLNVVVPSSTGVVALSSDQVYTLALNNHNGTTFIQNEILDIASLIAFNAANGTSLTLTITKNSGKVVDLKITNVGINYDSGVITIESPQQPGCSTATGSINVSGGKIYNAEIQISGNGYTEPPSVVVRGNGAGAGGAVIESVIEITDYAVRMGIATDVVGVTASTVPTKFEFEHPVYLQNNTDYALVIETDSVDYEVYASRLTETDLATGTAVTVQPLLGSVYRSQNTNNWTEDLLEDIKFTLYRARFDTTRSGTLIVTNQNLGYEQIDSDPFETYALANTNATSPLFKNNNSIVRISHRDHGFETSGKSYVFYKSTQDVGGFTSTVLNNTLFRISNSGLDNYTIVGPTRASANAIGGGKAVLASYNRKFERLFAHVSYIQPSGTSIRSEVKTTNIIPVDSNTTNYLTYSQSDYETTFLNETHYFLNQKVIASRINQTLNTLQNSLLYKFNLSSTADNLSPVIDLSVSSIKTATNRIENAAGKEDRFGKRYQVLKFLPVYRVNISGNSTTAVDANQTVQGATSGTRGKVLGYVSTGNYIWVQLTTEGTFLTSERLIFGTQSATGGNLQSSTVTVVSTLQKTFSFTEGTTVVAFNPSAVTQKYDNVITGKIIDWDPVAKQLTVENDKLPINSDYTSEITLGSAFSRAPVTANQSPDIFRVGDILYYDGISSGEEQYVKVSAMNFTTGVTYVPETASRNSSALAKYVTKEVVINNPGTAIDVRTTVNVKDIDNIKILYKIKETGSQKNLEDIDWTYFNNDGSPNNDVVATPANNVSPTTDRQEDYQELTYNISELPEFNSFAIKVVMKSDDPIFVPKVQDIRAVASY